MGHNSKSYFQLMFLDMAYILEKKKIKRGTDPMQPYDIETYCVLESLVVSEYSINNKHGTHKHFEKDYDDADAPKLEVPSSSWFAYPSNLETMTFSIVT